MVHNSNNNNNNNNINIELMEAKLLFDSNASEYKRLLF